LKNLEVRIDNMGILWLTIVREVVE